MTGPDVNTDGIRTHASHVSTIGTGVSEAIEAANSTQVGDGAFGVLCGWLAGHFRDMESEATTAFGKVGANLTYATGALNDMAADYDDQDAAAADLFESLQAGG